MSIEIAGEHDGMVGEVDLTGHTTYQFFINLADPADQVLTVFGNDENPTEIVAPAGYFNSLYASGPTAAGISTEGLALYPSLSFDSYVTIGLEQEPDLGNGESFIIVNEDINQQWVSNLFFPSATSGESIYMNTETGGSWFAMPGATNAIAGDDQRVLIAQFTSTDCLNGVLHALIAPADGSPAFILGQQFNCTDCGPIGCSDELACNFNPDAPAYPGSDADCTYPEEGYDCNGFCVNDSDLDGICDEFEIVGCTDSVALNFDEAATDDNGYCAYAEDLNCADEAACNFQPFAGPAYCLQIEPHVVHSGVVGTDDLTGFTTYRIYALCENTDDFVSSVSGDEEFPTRIQSTSSFFQSTFGGLTGSDQTAALFGFFPSAAFDSYITIGLTESAGSGEGNINTIDNPNNAWGDVFEDGGDLLIDDAIGGSWFIFNGNTNGIAGDDYRVLLAQVTTDGDLSGSMYVQFFENGSPAFDNRVLIDFQQACYGPEELAACEYPEDLLDCDGNCLNDADGDGICDEFEIGGCNDSAACNFDPEATDNDGSCSYAAEGYDCNGACLLDADGDGVCDPFEVAGCTDATACNFAADATDEDGSCSYPVDGYDCAGVCLSDADGDGVCDEFEISGCQDETACNYDAIATNAGDCDYAASGYDCEGNCLSDTDGDGVCDEFETAGCTVANACNYDASATDDDGTCDFCSCSSGGLLPINTYTMSVDVHGQDLQPGLTTYRFYINMLNDDDFLSSVYGNNDDVFELSTGNGFWNSTFGGSVASDINPAFLAFFPELNADSWVTIGIDSQNSGAESAISTVESTDQPWVGAFHTGVLSGQDIVMNDFAGGAWYVLNGTPNGLPDADGRVLFMQLTADTAPSGRINVQVFGNGLGENDLRFTYEFEGTGEFNPLGTDSEGTNENACGCTDPEAFNYDESAAYDDGSCIAVAEGCTDEDACNFDAAANTDDGTCAYPDTGYDCDGICLNDADSDGVCDEFEVAGCQDITACNYNADATDEDGSCSYPDAGYDCSGNCLADADSDGVCDEFEVAGCSDAAACNYNSNATDEDGSCTYADAGYDCDGNCLADADGDGVCDEFEIAGCTDAEACNYNAEATEDDGSCLQLDECGVCGGDGINEGACDCEGNGPEAGYDCDGACLSDTDGDGICDEFEIAGCTDASAANYDPFATDDDASCLEPICIDPAACNYTEWSGNDYCLIVQPYQVHQGGDLDGYVTYRIYIKTQNGDDFVSSVTGDAEFPTRIQSTGDFFQSEFGGLLGSDQAPALFGFFPEAAYDSYVTIGLTEAAAAGEGNINTIASALNPWGDTFEAGGDLAIDDAIGGGWFIFNGNTNGVAGDDEQVLLAQVTTDGMLSGSLYVQVFVNGNPNDDNRILLDLEDACVAPGGPEACEYADEGYDCEGACLNDADGDGICDEFEVAGCTDAEACNYDAEATDDDGSCLQLDECGVCGGDGIAEGACDCEGNGPEAGYDCDGNCLNDADGDGVCDEFEVAGCQDAEACNYNADATDSDDSCAYAEDGYDCDGNCLNDADGDGVCDEFEVAGCQDAAACNYNADATDEDGSCTYADAGYDCEGNCLVDADGDGVCDEFELAGCTDATACNYDAAATDDDGSCLQLDECGVCAEAMASRKARAIAKETDRKQATTATATACLMPTVMAYATNSKLRDVPMLLPVTTTLWQPMMTALASNSTNAECAEAMASLKARATAKETDQKPATTAMATASSIPTVTESATSSKSLGALTLQPATTTQTRPTTTVLVPMPTTATTATVLASATPTVTASATNLKSQDARTPLRPTTIRSQPTTMLRASSPFASTPRRATTQNGAETTTASSSSPTRCTKAVTSTVTSPTASTSRRRTATTSSRA